MGVGWQKEASAFWFDIFQGPKATFIFLMSEYQKTTRGNFGFFKNSEFLLSLHLEEGSSEDFPYFLMSLVMHL